MQGFVVDRDGAYPFLLLDEEQFMLQCRIDTYMASGHGGQTRNRTYSAVRATHLQTGLSVIAEESRSQAENKKRALRRLRKALALHIRQAVAAGPHASIRHLFAPDDPAQINPKNPLYPLFCATVLDGLHMAQGKISRAAQQLNISTGRMNKILGRDKDLFIAANQIRQHFGLNPLKLQ